MKDPWEHAMDRHEQEKVEKELTTLRERVRELEANEDAWRIKEINITCDNLRQESRIRELEEAMSEVKEKLLEPGWPEDKDLPGIADIIESVMTKPPQKNSSDLFVKGVDILTIDGKVSA